MCSDLFFSSTLLHLLLLLFITGSSQGAFSGKLVSAFRPLPVTTRLQASAKFSARLPLDIVVGLPVNEGHVLRNPYRLTIAKSQPVFDVAIEDIYYMHKLLPPKSLRITYVDTNLSDAIGPQRIIERYCERSVDAVMGLSYVYALAPVARMSQFWASGVPVFSTSALVDELGDKQQFPLLTRLMGTYKTVAHLSRKLVDQFAWHNVHFFFHDLVSRRHVGRSECFFSLNAIKNVFNQPPTIVWTVEMFNENGISMAQLSEMLKKASGLTNGKF
ncbi:unnamed protein product [Gongylonema pulchrum]|uniref:ANF_receptor domain-containing protein n=1 Tax=Gongylonema pulchrum TaxID=637853 RepID=A0A183D9K6_9BILA|nr:unnamed protein product [Gongylonema pulchrum]